MSSTLKFKSLPIAQALAGEIRVPGDKSISHRSVMFSSLANGTSRVSGLLEGDDVIATLNAFKQMGVKAQGPVDGKLTIEGVGMHGLKRPDGDLDMGNSGTAMRLICGILAAQKFDTSLVGDESLSVRPMKRVTEPLNSMGGQCQTEEDGTPPIQIKPSNNLHGIEYVLPVASAQIKSCLLLAGLYAEGQTKVTEPAPTRDHTERMLKAYGYDCQVEKLDDQRSTATLQGGGELQAADIDVPADISSAAFFIVAASIVPNSDILLKHVGVNPTRTGIIDILLQMGADIEFIDERWIGGEPVADIRVKYRQLQGIEVDPNLIPLAIDEVPILCVAAASAQGDTRISGAEELRHKESDRIAVMVEGLQAVGVKVQETPDGMVIQGGDIVGGVVESHHDHRISMSFSVAGAISTNAIQINGCENVATSFPNFVDLAAQLGLTILVDS
jgi:3-phosphoshikimate 1-carboxyvinyltransferase